MTFNELYHDALMQEEYRLAYKILHLQKRGIIRFSDPYDGEKFSRIDPVLLKQEYQQNEMGFIRYRAYGLRVGTLIYFVIAATSTEAKLYAKNHLGIHFTESHEVDLDTRVFTNNTFLTFREIKRNEDRVPILAGVYEETEVKIACLEESA